MSAELPEQYPVGQTWLFDIGEARIEHEFFAPNKVRYRVLDGPRAGLEETTSIHVEAVRPGVFIVSWQEGDGVTVVHVEDFAKRTFYSHVTRPGGVLARFKGSMSRVR
jgi:hypothetical protein